MTTYAGRSAGYVPGKEVVNKEPPVSKYVVEKLYRVHRERVNNMPSTIDSHVKIPDFLKNQTWKKSVERQRQERISQANQEIYDRISKLENKESGYRVEQKLHVKRIEAKSAYLKRLKEHGRLIQLLKIQKENEYLLRRIERAKPEYTKKKCDDWYKHHELFKAGRRFDPTAGHIMTGMGGLVPPPLPPLSSAGSVSASSLLTQSIARSGSSKRGGRNLPSLNGRDGSTIMDGDSQYPLSSSFMSNSVHFNSSEASGPLVTTMPPRGTHAHSHAHSHENMQSSSPPRGRSHRSAASTSANSAAAASSRNASAKASTRNSSAAVSVHGDELSELHGSNTGDKSGSHRSSSPSQQHLTAAQRNGGKHVRQLSFASFVQRKENEDDGGGSVNGLQLPFKFPHEMSRFDSAYFSAVDNESVGTVNSEFDNNSSSVVGSVCEDLVLITAKPFTIPFDSKNCLVQVFTSKSYDENLYLKVVSSGIAFRVYCERALSIDKAYEIVNAGGHSSQIVHSAEGEDLGSLSTLLINMFKEADDNGDGFLTFDEFQQLMEKVELGISSQELRFVISEADENENGVVDYHEFVELGVDLILSFRARNQAKNIVIEQDVQLDEQIMRLISTDEIETVAEECLEKIYEFDKKKYGLIRIPELKKSLAAVDGSKLSETEQSLICQLLPRDQFGRCKYNTHPNTFVEILGKVRFASMKNEMVEIHGSEMQKYLLDLCKQEEAKIEQGKGNKEKFAPTGIIPFRALINMLNNASRLSLSRLQVLVIMSEASVLDGMINYYQFIPVVAKAIEIMFEPKALRQRAELILKTDLSSEALLTCMQSDDNEAFTERINTLFKSFDVDSSDGLDRNEFVACLDALELQLTLHESIALFENADDSRQGHLSRADFSTFFIKNLLNLEKERHIRLLQSSMNIINHNSHRSGGSSATPARGISASHTGGGDNDNDTNSNSSSCAELEAIKEQEFEENFITQLTAIFKLSDPDNTGAISYEEFESILKNFSVNISRFLLDVMLSELQMTEEGLVDYGKSLSTCADLLKVFKAKESAIEEHKEKEIWAEEKALATTQAAIEDINHIVRYLRNKIKHINESTNDTAIRYNELHNLFRNPHSGLSRHEANIMIAKLLNGAGNVSPSNVESTQKRLKSSDSAAEGGGGASEKAPPAMSNYSGSTGSPVTRGKVIPKNFRGVFTAHELFDAVFESRKISTMRGLLQEVDATATQQTIIAALEKESHRLKSLGELHPDTRFLPVKACFSVLEKADTLRLNRAQVMFIISWAECFDKDGHSLDIYKFADHASAIIAKLNIPAMLETRTEVMNQGGIDEKKVLNGLKVKDLEKHLASAFQAAADENGEITHDQLWNILKNLPRIKLSERETTTIAAAFSHTEKINWQEILTSTVTTVRSLCKERVLNRRVSLAATASNLSYSNSARHSSDLSVDAPDTKQLREESLRMLKGLADKLLNFVKIQLQGDNIVLVLPSDLEKRRTSQLSSDNLNATTGTKEIISQLFRGVRILPMVTVRTVHVPPPLPTPQQTSPGPRRLSNRELLAAVVQKPVVVTEEIEGILPVLIRIISVEDTALHTVSLFANIIDIHAETLNCHKELAVKLPSLGLVDREAAEHFALNIVDKMSIECKQGVMSLKLAE